MVLPYDCGVTLPQVERYTDARFRRVSVYFDAYRLDQVDAVELVAFLALVPFQWSAFIFQWPDWMFRRVAKLCAHPVYAEAAVFMHEENLVCLTPEIGLAILSAMRDGGFSRGTLPPVVIDAMRELRKRGISVREIAERTGLSRDQVQFQTVTGVNRKRKAGASRIKSTAALSL